MVSIKSIANSVFRYIILSATCTLFACQEDKGVSLFDGYSLDGWECPDDIFRVDDGVIVGGSLDKPLKHSYYLCSEKEFDNFELSLQVKLNGGEVLRNAGVSFRASRVPNTKHVGGYQADIGYTQPEVITMFSDYTPGDEENPYPLWGILVDEFRPDTSRYTSGTAPVLLLEIPDRELVEGTVDADGWNEMKIVANGPDIQISLNGVVLVTYSEQEKWVPMKGRIGLQIHSGPPYEVMYKDIWIREL